jgi:LemA protein
VTAACARLRGARRWRLAGPCVVADAPEPSADPNELEDTMAGFLLIPLLLIVGLALLLVGLYNGLVALRQQVRSAWSQIDVQLKRRYDLIPNLVETVKGYAAHEKETLERVIQARNAAVAATGAAQHGVAEGVLGGALRQLFALSERYPDLKANQNFLSLQEELSATENKVGFARQHYNDVVASYNTRVQSFPAVVFAGALGFKLEEFFEIAEPTQREAPQVKFT